MWHTIAKTLLGFCAKAKFKDLFNLMTERQSFHRIFLSRR